MLVIRRESHEPIGLLLLHESTPDASELRLGYLIGESHWGVGYATELVRGLVEWARIHSYALIIAGVAADNQPSRRVLEKCGFSSSGESSSSELFYEIHLRS